MLPHWLNVMTDELNVCIRPNSLVIRRFKGVAGKTRCIDQQKIMMKKAVDHRDVEVAYLAKVLHTTLSQARWQAKTAKIVLANSFVRYAVLPWNPVIKTDEEKQGYLQHLFVSLYGDVVKSWNKTISPSGFGQPAVASAIPTPLIQTIDEIFASLPIQLLSIQPYLMSVMNDAIAVIKSQQLQRLCWLTVISDGRLCLGLMSEGQWLWLKNVQQENDVIGQIELLIQRERLINSVFDKAVQQRYEHVMLLHWPDISVSSAIKIGNYRIIRLPSSKLFAKEQPDTQVARLIAS